MLDGFLKQFGFYKLCAVQSLGILAYQWRQGQNQSYMQSSANFHAAVMCCIGNMWLLYNIENSYDTNEDIKSANKLLGKSAKSSWSISPFTFHALMSTVNAAITLACEEKTPSSIALTTCSAILAGISVYNRVYHDYEAPSR